MAESESIVPIYIDTYRLLCTIEYSRDIHDFWGRRGDVRPRKVEGVFYNQIDPVTAGGCVRDV